MVRWRSASHDSEGTNAASPLGCSMRFNLLVACVFLASPTSFKLHAWRYFSCHCQWTLRNEMLQKNRLRFTSCNGTTLNHRLLAQPAQVRSDRSLDDRCVIGSSSQNLSPCLFEHLDAQLWIQNDLFLWMLLFAIFHRQRRPAKSNAQTERS